MTLSSFSHIRSVFLVLLGLLSTIGLAEARTITARSVNGKGVQLNPSKGVSVVLYTNGDLEKQARAASKALDPYRLRKDFQLVRVVDLRGEVAPAVRKVVTKKIREELSKEVARLKRVAKKSGGSKNPKNAVLAVADFSGGTLGKLGWNQYSEHLKAIVYKNGKKVKSFNNASPSALKSYVSRLLKG